MKLLRKNLAQSIKWWTWYIKKNIWINRSDQYSQLRALGKTDKEKVEMYKIGG